MIFQQHQNLSPSKMRPHSIARARLALLGMSMALLSACAQINPGQPGYWALNTSEGLQPHLVDIQATSFQGQDALAVELTPGAQKALLEQNGTANGASYAKVPVSFKNGTIEVDVAARINSKGPADVRGFVGIAFHLDDQDKTFEALYLRMTNGTANNPPPPAPRNEYGVQYISIPGRDWKTLRQTYPNRYEKAAPVAIERWHKLRLEIQNSTLRAFVDQTPVLEVPNFSYPGRQGAIGLWVDDGTTGYFRNLKITSQD